MSSSESPQTDRTESPYPRRDWWGEHESDPEPTGHTETAGTDAASYVAFSELLQVTTPHCERTLRERGEEVQLSEPSFYLPKQIERNGRYIEYRQHRHRRRVNEETGYINWGETTSTAVPDVDEETYMLAFANYLARRHGRTPLRPGTTEEYLNHARRQFYIPDQSSHEALTNAIAFVREREIE